MKKEAETHSNAKQDNKVSPLRPFLGRRLSNRDAEIRDFLDGVLESIENGLGTAQRDWAVKYLEKIYRAFWDWKTEGRARSMARHVRKLYRLRGRKDAHPSRVLIDVTSPGADRRRKSRWTRAIEAAMAEKVSPSQFEHFVRRHGGLAGTARLIARPRSARVKRDDWTD